MAAGEQTISIGQPVSNNEGGLTNTVAGLHPQGYTAPQYLPTVKAAGLHKPAAFIFRALELGGAGTNRSLKMITG